MGKRAFLVTAATSYLFIIIPVEETRDPNPGSWHLQISKSPKDRVRVYQDFIIILEVEHGVMIEKLGQIINIIPFWYTSPQPRKTTGCAVEHKAAALRYYYAFYHASWDGVS